MDKRRKFIFDKSGGKCWYCGCELGKRWHEDHFYPVVRMNGKMLYPELDKEENKVPSCPPCNNFKSSMNIDGYRGLVSDQFDNVLKYSTGARQLKRLGLIDISRKPVVFWFEENGILMPDEADIIGISDEARLIEWSKDKTEREYYYYDFGSFICTLKHVGDHYIAIAVNFNWEELGRERIRNGRLAFINAAEWAIRLRDAINE